MSDRLIGVETEYALGFQPREPGGRAPVPREIYEILEGAIRGELASLPAAGVKGGIFLVNGGLVHYEAPTVRFSTGLLEMATPECRGALEAARYHHAQDRLLLNLHADVERRLRNRGYDGDVIFLKASADAAGNVWGSHENYEVDDPAGWRWPLIAVAFPLFWIPFWIAEFLLKAILYPAVVAVGLLYLLFSALSRLPAAGRLFSAAARSLYTAVRSVLREDNIVRIMNASWLLTLPWVRAWSAFLRFAILRPARRQLLPHFITRSLYAGSGRVDPAGLTLSQKGPAIRTDSGVYWDDSLRPIVDLKNFVREPWTVFSRRKRLQVLFSDSSSSRFATFLKLGTTDLILRMIEAGHPIPDMTLADPMDALRRVLADTSLRQSLALRNGASMTALEIQKMYLVEAEKFYGKAAEGETGQVLKAWRYVLGALEEDPHLLYKELDWVAKRDLLSEALGGERGLEALVGSGAVLTAEGATAAKIDARFHEVTPRGYWHVLEEAGQVKPFFTNEELDRAMREPPSAPTSRQRGDAVRQFAGSEREATVSWKQLHLKNPRRTMRFTR